MRVRRLAFALGFVSAVLTGCDRSTETKTATPAPPSEPEVQTTTFAPRPDTPATTLYTESSTATATERSVEIVNSVAVRHPPNASNSLVIRATGIVASQGWSNPRLVEIEEETSDPTVKRYKFTATPPDGTGTGPAGSINVQLRVDGVRSEVKTIEVASATNSISVMIVRPSTVQSAQLP